MKKLVQSRRALHVMRERTDVVATKLGIILVRTQCVRTNGFRAGVDVVATKLGIIGANKVSAHARFEGEGRRSGH